MKTLEQIRKEWNERPIDGPDPVEIEKKFPKREDLIADKGICTIEGCNAEVFRGLKFCREHHLENCAKREAEAEKREKEYYKRRSRKDWPKKEAQERVRCQTICANCGNPTTSLAERTVQLKPKNRRPKKPKMLDYLYEMLCIHCAK